ncbi:MAG: ATP-binding protein [Candidatus Aenigmatarchaeota archaeon]
MPRTLGRVLRTFERRLQELGQLKAAVQRADWAGLKAIRSQLHISQAELAKRAGASQSLISQYELGKCGKRKSNKILEKLRKALYDACTSILGDDWLKARMKALRTLLDSDIFWDRIKNVQKMPSNQKWVYDLQVPGVHNFLANQIFVHNSQLMKLVPNLVPRGRYVSGKGVTTAGLTATVTKDEQFMGGWVLEAGAIVLANKGLLSVDEFEKMSPDDQVAMHEALEQGSVSIAKASIVTTLPAQTSVLAGGNPKFSRFDPYQPISKQITIPDTLLSRFDLKFVLRDQPNPEEDQKIVDHILGSREEDHTASIPKMPSDFIRKYVAYAKEHCQPVHTKETGKILKTFYVESRRKALKEGAPVPITLRQFEALMRLSEASAKIQLSPLVRKEDAKRAIKLMKFSLRQLGYDPETGLIDVDKAEGLTTASERSHIRAVLDIIELLSQKKKEIKIDEIEEAAKKEGVPNPSEIVDRLKREGMLFEPSPGHVQKV